MRPASFTYQRPKSVAEAVQMLNADGAKALAGGHSLIPAMNQRLNQPGTIVDLGRLDELKGVSITGNSRLEIGALTPHVQIATSPNVRKYCRALAQACGILGDPQVRNWGTLGGNIAHADPASDPPTVVLASDARINVLGASGARSVSANDFFLDLFTTALQPGEIITSIEIPMVVDRKSAYAKLPHPASRYAVAGVAVFLDMGNGVCTHARVAVGGATSKATRSPGAERALTGSTLGDGALDAAANALMADITADATSDLYAPAEYRVAMAGVMFKQAARAALA